MSSTRSVDKIVEAWKSCTTWPLDLIILSDLMQIDESTKSQIEQTLLSNKQDNKCKELHSKFECYKNLTLIQLLTEYFNAQHHDPFKPNFDLYPHGIKTKIESILKNASDDEIFEWINALKHRINRGLLNFQFSDGDCLSECLAKKNHIKCLLAIAQYVPQSFYGFNESGKMTFDLLSDASARTQIVMKAAKYAFLKSTDELDQLQFREKYNADESNSSQFQGFANKMTSVYCLALDAFSVTVENPEDKLYLQKAIDTLCNIHYLTSYTTDEITTKVAALENGKSLYFYAGFSGDEIGHHAIVCYSRDNHGDLHRIEYNAGFGAYPVDEHKCYGICKQKILPGKESDVIALDYSNYRSNENNYVVVNQRQDLLEKPDPNQSQLVGTQLIGNCTTRSTRELIRSILPLPLFRRVYRYVTHTPTQEILTLIKPPAERSPSVPYVVPQRSPSLFKKNISVHRTAAKVLAEEMIKLDPKNTNTIFTTQWMNFIENLLKLYFPSLNTSRANKIINDCIYIIRSNAYDLFRKPNDRVELENQLLSLNKPDINIMTYNAAFSFSVILLRRLSMLVQQQPSSIRIGYLTQKESDYIPKDALMELTAREDWNDIKIKLEDQYGDIIPETLAVYGIAANSSPKNK